MAPTVNSTSYATVHIKQISANSDRGECWISVGEWNGWLYISIIDKVLQLNNTYVLI